MRGGWEEKPLGKVITAESSSLALNKLEFGNKGYPVYGASGLVGLISSFEQNNDYIAIVKDGSGVGNLFFYKKKSSILGTLIYIKPRNNKDNSLCWIYYLLHTINFSKYKKGSGIPHIYYSDYANELIFTASFKKQQRIADCLSSIDALITLQSQKIETLKEHKKGLMQQLFPAEGETLPKLRFPEFRDTGGWEEKPLGKFLEESRIRGNSGDTAKKLTVKLWGKGVFKKEDNLKGSQNTQYYQRKYGQFIYSKLDFLNQAFGIVPDYLDGFESTVDLPCFDIKEVLHPVFLLEYVKRKDFYKKYGEIADGGRKAKRIQAEAFLSFPILLPRFEEQQRIADCLSSIDALISLQSQKIETLKEHKKGLMQQLFPSVEEVMG